MSRYMLLCTKSHELDKVLIVSLISFRAVVLDLKCIPKSQSSSLVELL